MSRSNVIPPGLTKQMDPRVGINTFITGSATSPANAPNLWIKVAEATLRYDETTDYILNPHIPQPPGYPTSSSIVLDISASLLSNPFFLGTLTNNIAFSPNSSVGGLNPTVGANYHRVVSATALTSTTVAISFGAGSVNTGTTFTSGTQVILNGGKSVVEGAIAQMDIYTTSLVARQLAIDPGNSSNTVYSFTSPLPATISRASGVTIGTPFSVGGTTVTPTMMTSNGGVYSSSITYQLGNIVYFPTTDGSKFMCVAGPNYLGVTTGIINIPPISPPGSSIYWFPVTYQGYDTWTYNSAKDLSVSPTGFGSIFWSNATYIASPLIQIPDTTLNGFQLFGTGIGGDTFVASNGFLTGFSSTTFLYKLSTTGALINSNLASTFYVRNALSTFVLAASNALFGSLVSYAQLAILATSNATVGDNEESDYTAYSATADYNISQANLVYTTLLPTNSKAPLIINAASTCATLIPSLNTASFLIDARSNAVPFDQDDLNQAISSFSTIVLQTLQTVSSAIASLSITSAGAANLTASNAVVTESNLSYFAYMESETYNNINVPSTLGYIILPTATTPTSANYGNPEGYSVATYITKLTQSNAWNIGTGDYTLEFVCLAGDVMDSTGGRPDYFASPQSATVLMGLNNTTPGTNLGVYAGGSGWNGTLGFNANGNSWGPLYNGPSLINNNALTPASNFSANSFNRYNFGYRTQNHYCEVRRNGVNTAYLNGNQIMQYTWSGNSNIQLSNLPSPASWHIGGPAIGGIGGNRWTGGIRNIRLTKEAIYTSSFNTSSTICGSNSVFYTNLTATPSTILLMPMNKNILHDYSPIRLKTSTLNSGYSGSTIRFLSTFVLPPTFDSYGITPIAHFPLSTNMSNVGSDPQVYFSTNANLSQLQAYQVSTTNYFKYTNYNGRIGAGADIWHANITTHINFPSISSFTVSFWTTMTSVNQNAMRAIRLANSTTNYSHAANTTVQFAQVYQQNRNDAGTDWFFVSPPTSNASAGKAASLFGGFGQDNFDPQSPSIASARYVNMRWNHVTYTQSWDGPGLSTISISAAYNGVPRKPNSYYATSNVIVNGSNVLQSNVFVTRAISTGTNVMWDRMYIGCWGIGGDGYAGLFKDVMIFDRALNSTQTTALYYQQLYSNRN